MLPDLLFIGAMKAGTTTLATALAQHPGLWVNNGKGRGGELHHLNRSSPRDVEAFRARFGSPPRGVRVINYSTGYTTFPRTDCAPAAHAIMPDARLLYVIREPFARLRSHWAMRIREGTDDRPLEQTIAELPALVAISQYGLQLQQYLEHYPPDRILVMTLDDVAQDLTGAVQRVADFVDAEGGLDGEVTTDAQNTDTGTRTVPWARRLLWSEPMLWARRVAPSGVRRRARQVLTRPVEYPSSDLSDATTERLIERFASDLELVRDFLPDGWDGWGLLDQS